MRLTTTFMMLVVLPACQSGNPSIPEVDGKEIVLGRSISITSTVYGGDQSVFVYLPRDYDVRGRR